MKERINQITVSPTMSILAALRRMDEVGYKLLLLRDGEIFLGLLSVGDIQRAIIKNVDMSAPISTILRKEFLTCSDTLTREEIKREFLRACSVFMPILTQDNRLVDVAFWDEFFPSEYVAVRDKLGLPVVIMAGGVGSRLQPLTNVIPKPLVPLGKKTMIETIMDRFLSVDCSRFLVSVNYKANLLRYYFEHESTLRYDISFFQETKPMGTAGSLSLIKDQLKSTFFVSNCDSLIDQGFDEILAYHRSNSNELTIVSALKHVRLAYGSLHTGDDGLLKRLEEKPEFVFKVNTGVYILEPSVLADIHEGEFLNMTDLIDRLLSRNSRIGCFPVSEGSWIDIGSWAEYQSVLESGDFNG